MIEIPICPKCNTRNAIFQSPHINRDSTYKSLENGTAHNIEILTALYTISCATCNETLIQFMREL